MGDPNSSTHFLNSQAYLHIKRTLEMTSDALTNAGKHVTSNNACARCQRYTDDSVF